jgi:protein TonB
MILLRAWLIFTLLGTTFRVSAQGDDVESSPCTPDSMETFSIVEQMPKFPGGEAEMFRYLAKEVKFAHYSSDGAPSDRTYITFVIRQDGRICGVEVFGGWPDDFAEQMRTKIYAMPQWEPGRNRGKPVNVRYYLPFKIHGK